MSTEKESPVKTLIMMVGLPRSGKTTIARNLGHPIVCPDAVRFAIHGQRYISEAEAFVWPVTKAMVKALFLAGHDTVILDATNTTKKRRAEWKNKKWVRKYWQVNTTAEECKQRAINENDSEIIPVIARMASEFEPITLDEHDDDECATVTKAEENK